MNIELRLRLLDGHLSAITVENRIDWIVSMAEATMLVCVADAANAMLMNWALLETPEFARDLYRNESLTSHRSIRGEHSSGSRPLVRHSQTHDGKRRTPRPAVCDQHCAIGVSHSRTFIGRANLLAASRNAGKLTPSRVRKHMFLGNFKRHSTALHLHCV
jgi:hypothetical protein